MQRPRNGERNLYSLIRNLLRGLRNDERGFILATSMIILLVLLLTMTAYHARRE